MTHQCLHCELRFATESELTEHLRLDHPGDRSVYERYHYPSDHASKAPLYSDMREPAQTTLPPEPAGADESRPER